MSAAESQSGRTLRIGTRGSTLATTQAGTIRDALRAAGYDAELVIISTSGDTSQADGTPVAEVGVGVFTDALRTALSNDECDIAVHSFKDLPTAPHLDFHIVVPERVNPSEILISQGNVSLSALAPGATVGTSAPRRIAQLRATRQDLNIQPLRGNIDTRMSRVGNDLDAIILARAGLERVGALDKVSEVFNPTAFMPAPAQGALAVEVRTQDTYALDAITPLDDIASHAQAVAERSVLSTLEAGCSAPVGAYSTIDGQSLSVHAGVFALDGTDSLIGLASVVLGSLHNDQDPQDAQSIYERAHNVGRVAGTDLLDRGAADLMS